MPRHLTIKSTYLREPNIISTVLDRELEPTVRANALAAVRVSSLTAGEGGATEVKGFPAKYRTTTYSRGASSSPATSFEEVSSLARLHMCMRIIALKSYDFTVAARPELPKAEITDSRPSKTELRSIYPALCRFEMFCTLFGLHRVSSKGTNQIEANGRDMAD
jgi:hypothetical protein